MAKNLKSNIVFLILLGITVIMISLFIITGTVLPLQDKILNMRRPTYVVDVKNRDYPREKKVIVNKHLDETNIYMNAHNPPVVKPNSNNIELPENKLPDQISVDPSKFPPPPQPFLMAPPEATSIN